MNFISKAKRKILFIGGSVNQTSMLHKVSMHLRDEYDCYFTQYYADGYLDFLAQNGALDWCILGPGSNFQKDTNEYIVNNNLNMDYKGLKHEYDLVVTGSDLIIPKNIKNKRLILVQEGMTDPKNYAYYLAKYMKLPRWIASTSTNGLSDAYDYFCVASKGYKQHFIKNGVKKHKIRVTGIPNFDDLERYLKNDFPFHNFVLVATSDSRETFKYENRKKIVLDALKIANGKKLIFKLHPNENYEKATAEINKYAPEALVYRSGNVHEMIANCDVLITQFSTVVYTGIALGKEVYSEFPISYLKELTPIQNAGRSSQNIAKVCHELMQKDINKNKKDISELSKKLLNKVIKKRKNIKIFEKHENTYNCPSQNFIYKTSR